MYAGILQLHSKARKQQLGRGFKFLNLPEDYKLISYHSTEEGWRIRISFPWFSCSLLMEFRVKCFSSPQLPSSRHRNIQPLLGTGWKQAQHYHPPLLMNIRLALQLYWNIDRNTIFTLSPSPLGSSHPPAVTVVHLTGDMACSYRVGQQRTAPNWSLSHATETWTNKNRSPSRARDLCKWCAHFQS